MERTLYVFVDESGNPSQGRYYTLAGCWCLSDAQKVGKVLSPTIDRLKSIACDHRHGETSFSELKGSALHPEELDTIVSSAKETAYDDKTLPQDRLPWRISSPIRYSLAQTHTEISLDILRNRLESDPDAPHDLQKLSLVSILDPLLREQRIDRKHFGEVKVVLDSPTWKTVVNDISSNLVEASPVLAKDSFLIRESSKTPGIQMADLGVYSWARHIREGDCPEATRAIHELRFANK